MLIVKVGDSVRLKDNKTIKGVVTYVSEMTQSALVDWDFKPALKYTTSTMWHNYNKLESETK